MVKRIVRNENGLNYMCIPLPDNKINIVIRDLLETANAHYNEMLGLAANQIGYPYRAFVIKIQGYLIPFVNPVMECQSHGKGHAYEGCLSRPGQPPIWKARFNCVKFRSKDIVHLVDGYSIDKHRWMPTSKTGIWTFKKLLARVVQHEWDHMDGKLI